MGAAFPVIDVRILNGIRDGMVASGLPFVELLERAGLDPARVGQSSGDVSLNSVGLLFDLAADAAGDPDFGVRLGACFPPGGSGVLGHIMLTAGTVRHMLRLGAEFMPLHTRPVDCMFTEEPDGGGAAAWSYSSQFTAPRAQFSLFAIAVLVERIRRAAGPSWVPLAVECDFKAPRDLALLTRKLGPRVSFDRAQIAVRLDRAALDARLPQQMFGLDVTMLEFGRRLLAEITEASGHCQIVERHLRRRMRSGLALGLEDVAADMSLTPRALQYRLEQEDTGFEAILSTVRVAETVHYLRDSDLSLSEIAGLLGFSEASAFTRAVRHRFQMTPRDLRRELQAGRLIVPPLQ